MGGVREKHGRREGLEDRRSKSERNLVSREKQACMEQRCEQDSTKKALVRNDEILYLV